jgi:hypothetical protein
MSQPATGWIACSECNASYDSQAKLREHQMMSHRRTCLGETPETEAPAEQSKKSED